MEVFDPATGAWSTAAPMLSGRLAHSSVVLDGKLYVTGGKGARAHQSVEVFDPATGAWSTTTDAPPAAKGMLCQQVEQASRLWTLVQAKKAPN